MIYLRISDDEAGQRAGVERQRTDCEALVARNGWDLVERYEDNDRIAFSGKPREDFDRMLADAAGARSTWWSRGPRTGCTAS